jgi:hypothetical protein
MLISVNNRENLTKVRKKTENFLCFKRKLRQLLKNGTFAI